MGNIIIKRLSQHDVIIRGYEKDQCAIAKDVLEANGELPADTSVKLFDIKKFQSNITRELRSSYPNRAKLESQCIVGVGFVKDADNVLELPVWCMLINIVALDMLRSRIPPTLYRNQELNGYGQNVPKFISIFDRAEGQPRSVQDEDPYSVPSLPKLITDPSANSQLSSGYSTGGYGIENRPISDRNGAPLPAQSRRYASNGANQAMVHAQKQANEKENNPIPPELPPRDFAKIGSPAGQPAVKKSKSRPFAKVFRFRKSSDDRKKKAEKEDEDESLPQMHSQPLPPNDFEYGQYAFDGVCLFNEYLLIMIHRHFCFPSHRGPVLLWNAGPSFQFRRSTTQIDGQSESGASRIQRPSGHAAAERPSSAVLAKGQFERIPEFAFQSDVELLSAIQKLVLLTIRQQFRYEWLRFLKHL